MEKKQDINLMILEEAMGVNDYLSFLKVSGKQNFLIDTSKEQIFGISKTAWLRWKDQFYISLPAIGIAEKKLKALSQKVNDRKSDLYKCLKVSTEVSVLAKETYSGEEGILNVTSRKYLEILMDSYKLGELSGKSLEVTTVVSGKGEKKKTERVPFLEDSKEKYVSELTLAWQEEPNIELVEYYINTVKRLALGENLDPDKIREEYNSIREKYETKTLTTDSIEDIFGPSSVNIETGEITEEEDDDEELELSFKKDDEVSEYDSLMTRFDELSKLSKLSITSKIEKKIKSLNGLRQVVEKLEQQMRA